MVHIHENLKEKSSSDESIEETVQLVVNDVKKEWFRSSVQFPLLATSAVLLLSGGVYFLKHTSEQEGKVQIESAGHKLFYHPGDSLKIDSESYFLSRDTLGNYTLKKVQENPFENYKK
ncbi:MAG: hypothetical protein KC535_00610 [Nanoarchaeota archaeon]|nr:hypothetical protein [Nanoarchaeota archaeon]